MRTRIREYRLGVRDRLKGFLCRFRYSQNDFEHYRPRWNGIYGWLSEEQGRLLFELARQNGPPGDIVEIGRAYGRSTVCLGWGARQSKNGKVFAVDPHTGGIGFLKHLGTDAAGFSSRKG